MLQIVKENRRPSFGENFASAIEDGIKGYNQHNKKLEAEKMNSQANQMASQLLGFDVSGIDPETRKALMVEGLKQRGQSNKFSQEMEFDNQSYDVLKNQFGKKFADIWKTSTEGGRTELLKQGLDAKLRGQDINEMLSQVPDEQIIESEIDEPFLSELEKKKPKGMTQAEWTKEKRGHLYEVNKPILNELGQLRKNIALQEQALEDIETASPDVGMRDYIAEKFNFEPLRTESGVKLKTAVKDFFLSDLTRAGTRPNQWIEQQLASALPMIGRDPSANLITNAGLRFKVDMSKKRAEFLDDLSEKYGYSSIDLDRTANKMMKSYVTERQKILEQEIRNIKTKNKPEKLSGRFIDVQGPDGEMYEVDESEVGQLPEGYFVL